MFKYLKGDLLIFTNRGLIRIDNIKKTDLILALNSEGFLYYEEIDELEKTYRKKYTLNKINLVNNIDSYYLNDNIEIKAIQNIPLNIETNDLTNYISYNENKCCCKTRVGDISSFDYIGFPTVIKNDIYEIKDDNYYRFHGLLLSIGNLSTYTFNNDTFDFIISYLKDNNIAYEINNAKIIIKDEIKQIELEDIFNITKEQLKILGNAIMELDSNITTNNKQTYYIIKYVFILLGISINSYYKDGYIIIKISKTNFNYNNLLWNKIKSIKKVPNFNGNLYTLKLKTNNFYLTDLGFIS